MTLANPSSELHNAKMIELSALETAIAAIQHYLAVAKRRSAELTAELAPAPTRAGAESAHSRVPNKSLEAHRCRRGYDYRGETVRCHEKKGIWTGLMQQLLDDFPDKHADIVQALRSKGRNRSYLSSDRTTLFEKKDAAWVTSHSTKLHNGWYLDTNLEGERMLTLLRTVVRVLDLTWGKDVIVRLNSQRLHLRQKAVIKTSLPEQCEAVHEKPEGN